MSCRGQIPSRASVEIIATRVLFGRLQKSGMEPIVSSVLHLAGTLDLWGVRIRW
jgi:hypothetical protein